MAQAVEDVVETKVVGKRVKEGRFGLSNGSYFVVEDEGREFRFAPGSSSDTWSMRPRSYRELAAELTAIADAMEFGKVGVAQEAPVERSDMADAVAYAFMGADFGSAKPPSPLVFTVRSEGWPRLGLYNSGALAFFHDHLAEEGNIATVIDKGETSSYKVGEKGHGKYYNPLPKDGVLIHQQEGDSFPKLGLSNSGSLVLFETPSGAGFMVHQIGRGGYRDGERVRALYYNPLPAGGVLLKPEV